MRGTGIAGAGIRILAYIRQVRAELIRSSQKSSKRLLPRRFRGSWRIYGICYQSQPGTSDGGRAQRRNVEIPDAVGGRIGAGQVAGRGTIGRSGSFSKVRGERFFHDFGTCSILNK
jgi:hypothetical protein